MDIALADSAYAAGFFDGEGSLAISNNGRDYYRVHIIVGQKNPEILYWLQERWTGNVIPVQWSASSGYLWQVSAKRARKFLSDILPFLIGKRAQVEYVLNAPVPLRDYNVEELKRIRKEGV